MNGFNPKGRIRVGLGGGGMAGRGEILFSNDISNLSRRPYSRLEGTCVGAGDGEGGWPGQGDWRRACKPCLWGTRYELFPTFHVDRRAAGLIRSHNSAYRRAIKADQLPRRGKSMVGAALSCGALICRGGGGIWG